MTKSSFLAGFAGMAALSLTASAETVYDNSLNDLTNRFEVGGTYEVGDEITLGGTYRIFDGFDFEYYYTNQVSGTPGSPTFEITLYNNDGPTNGSGYATPGSVIWGSGTVGGVITAFTERDTIVGTSVDIGGTYILPETFTWTVKFGNLSSNDEIGLDIYSPPIVGSSSRDYWINMGSGWELREAAVDPENNPYDFAARFYAVVPEPSCFALALLGGLALLARRQRS
jgi:hypothetical protein